MIPEGDPVRNRQTTIAKCIAPPLQVAKYTWPGSNWRPSACEADVIATRPQVLRNPGGGRGASVNASHPAWTRPQTRTWNLIRRIQRLHHCSLQFRLEWGPAAKANVINRTIALACVLWLQPSPIWPCGLMCKALVLGTKDCRFESCQGHFASQRPNVCCMCAGHVPLCGRARRHAFMRRCASVCLLVCMRCCARSVA